ncbi:MAG: TIM barrel protein [Epulopiscium sp.]|nr:TIM barrel protein [Candidatus Epulonipiscium sp.]
MKMEDYIKLGISPTMLMPDAFEDDMEHLAAFVACCKMQEYETLDTFLPHNKEIREYEIKMLKKYNKVLNYNTPIEFQLDGEYNPASDNSEYRANAVKLAKTHIDYAAEAGVKVFVVTGCADKGPDKRSELLERYKEYFLQVADYAEKHDMLVAIEPIERDVFKKIILGPTDECADFIQEMQEKGASNARLMLDSAHLPLMDETFDFALSHSLRAGLAHIHIGDAVSDPNSEYYGHTHPPLGVQGGVFDRDELTEQFVKLIECGHIKKVKNDDRPTISLEMRPYIGVSPETSARFAYEKVNSAFKAAMKKCK